MVAQQKRPLVILTRPEGRNAELQQALFSADVPSLTLPALQLQLLPPNCANLALPDQHDLIIFVSGRAVEFYEQALKHCGKGQKPKQPLVVASVGQATAQALRRSAFFSECRLLCPSPDEAQDSESLWNHLQPELNQYPKVLIIRAESGRDWLSQRLANVAGLQLTRQAVYRRQPRPWQINEAQQLKTALAAAQPIIIVLTSSASIDAFFEQMRQHRLSCYLSQAVFVIIHPRLTERLRKQPEWYRSASEPKVLEAAPTNEAMFAKISSYIQKLA